MFLFLLFGACSSGSATPLNASYCQTTVDSVAALHEISYPSVEFLQGLVDGTMEGFDVNEYFSVLTHLSMQEGFTLGYQYYLQEDFGGLPMLHARPSQYATLGEYIQTERPDLPEDHSYSDHIRMDGTAEGFFEFVVLRVMGDQFYLYWHAASNDAQIIGSQAGLDVLLDQHPRLPADVKLKARLLDVVPVVEMGDDTVSVVVVTFSNFGGFVRRTYIISRDFPHKVLRQEKETLVEYDSGIRF